MTLQNGRRRKEMIEYKWIVWVGGVDEYFDTYYWARHYAENMMLKGYDDVILEENVDAKETN